MFGLDTDTTKNIKNCFSKLPQIEKVLLYGSRAKGNYKNGSDIDLTLLGKNLNSDNSIYPLQEALEKLYLPYTFDISIFKRLDNLDLIEQILRVGKTFYQKENNELPVGWEIKKLGDVCEVIAGQSPEGKYYNNKSKGLAFYQGKKEFTKKFIGKPTKWTTKTTKIAIKDDILMSVRAPVGPVNFSNDKICIGRGLAIIRANKKIDKEFLFNFLVMQEGQITGNTGAVFNSISKSQIENIQIPIPPLAEQNRIVSVLDKAFQAIDEMKNNSEKNLANTKELWQSYLQQSFTNPKKNWQQKKLSTLFDIQPPKKNALETLQKQDKISFVPMNCLNIGNKNLTLKQTKLLKDAYSGYTYFSDNDVLLAKITPCFENGKIGIAKNLANGIGFGSSEFIVFRNKGKVLQDYLYYYLSQKSFRIQGKKRMGGAVGHKRLAKDFIKNYSLSYPSSLAEQKQITERLDTLSEKTTELQKNYRKKIQNLVELKNSLLKKAFTGQL